MDISSLDRFLTAQALSYELALSEIRQGRKRSHWMWYIFPQLRALGRSTTAYTYGIADADEARAYLAHPVLSARLIEISTALLAHRDKSAYAILGEIDGIKLRSSMTLFALVSESGSVFHQVLDAFFGGEMDALTLGLVEQGC